MTKLFIRENNNGFFWNSLAGIINAAEAVILSVVITRTNGIEDAGILAIAFATGNLMRTIGLFGVRTYQATDVTDKFKFNTYFFSRIFSMLLMVLMSIGLVGGRILWNGYSFEKALVVLLICAIYVVEAFEDIFYGFYQRYRAIDIGGKCFCLRWGITLLVMCAVLIIRHDLLLACVWGFAVSLVICIVLVLLIFPAFRGSPYCLDLHFDERPIRKAFSLTKEVFPLFLISFLSFYINNAPKFSIDRYMDEAHQACYGFVAMPVFVIGLLTSFIYHPMLADMSIQWQNRNYTAFYKNIRQNILIILGVGVLCFIGAWFLGIPLLSWLYFTDLANYKACLMVIMIAGLFEAISIFFAAVITIIRRQKFLMWTYLAAAALSLAGFNPAVRMAGIIGAAVLFLVIAIIIAAAMSIYNIILRKSLN